MCITTFLTGNLLVKIVLFLCIPLAIVELQLAFYDLNCSKVRRRLNVYLLINIIYIIWFSRRKRIFSKMTVNNRPTGNKKNCFTRSSWRRQNGEAETCWCFIFPNEKCVAVSDVTGSWVEIKDKKWREKNCFHLLPSRYGSSRRYFSTEVAGTLELEEDFLHKSSLSRALCVPVRTGSKWRMVRRKNKKGEGKTTGLMRKDKTS